MEQQTTVSRNALIYGACIGVAVLLGYLLSDTMSRRSLALVGGFVGAISLPILLKWYHPLLIVSWNANIAFWFLPGKPSIAFLMSLTAFGVAVLSRCMSTRYRFHNDRFLTWALVVFVGVLLVTAYGTGGIGLRSAGSDTYGGKKYFFILGAVMGYLGLVSRGIPARHGLLVASLFILSALTAMLSYLIYFAGPAAYVLFNFFPPEMMGLQGLEGIFSRGGMVRWAGLSTTGSACCFFLMLKYGVRGLLNIHKPWRGLCFLFFLVVSLLGGFRSVLLLIALTFWAQFFLEGLHRTRFLPVVVGIGLAVFLVSLPFIDQMPLSVQRTLSVLPVEVDPIAEADARESTEWRVDMWQRLTPMISRYFWYGKGFSIDPIDLYFAEQGVLRGVVQSFEPALVVGNYHNGGLSVLIGFGIFGLISFILVLVASLRILYRNHRRGDPALASVNTFLLAYFIARIVSFFLVVGDVSVDVATFLGIVGLSVSLNVGAAGRDETGETEQAQGGLGEEAQSAMIPA